MNFFIFDIETIPDIRAGRRLLNLGSIADEEVAKAMFQQRLETAGHDFLPHTLHQVVCISVVFKSHQGIKVWSLGDKDAPEQEILQRFFDGIEKYTPTLVSWNGSGFDLPVLHYRTLLHGISAGRYFETGDEDNSFRWNNYLNRYHERHTDLMDVLAGFQARANAKLDDVATLLGFPGKMGMSGGSVWEQYCAGQIEDIRNYCETDVLNTYLIFLRFELIRGHLSADEYQHHLNTLKEYLLEENKPHFQNFINAWNTDE